MIHALLVLAAVVFIIWLLFHAAGAVVHLLWIVILVALALWLFNVVFRGGGRRTL
jgi:hypothetical protein